MDSFEASTQFSQLLRQLTPQMQSLMRAAHFALKNCQSEDYFCQAIVDVVEDAKVDLNTKSTIFQFIEVLIHESFMISEQPKSTYNYPYIATLKLQLPKVLLQTLPGSNCSALYNVYMSLKNISKTLKFNYKNLDEIYHSIQKEFSADDVKNIAENIPFPVVTEDDILDEQDHLVMTWKLLIRKKKQSQYERLRQLQHKPIISAKYLNEGDLFDIKTEKDDPAIVLSKRQILARMEDDRESHKRSKETLWMVQRPRESQTVTEEEFLSFYWNKYSQLSSDEDIALLQDLEELNQLVALSYKDSQV